MVRIHREPTVFPRALLIDNCIRQQEFFLLRTVFLHLYLKCLVKKDSYSMNLLVQLTDDVKWLRYCKYDESLIRRMLLKSIANSPQFHSYIRTSINLFYIMNKPV